MGKNGWMRMLAIGAALALNTGARAQSSAPQD